MPFFKFTVTDTLERILQGVEELLRVAGRLPGQPANLPAVPTITKSIGTSSRDYSTITAWEADLDNGAVYASGDTALGECYDDSAFDETLAINGGGTVGLADRILSVASGERHTGVAGTGARIVRTGNGGINIASGAPSTIRWLEFDMNGNSNSSGQGVADQNASGSNFEHLLIHDVLGNPASMVGIRLNSAGSAVRCILYDISNNGSSSFRLIYGIINNSNVDANALNCTVHSVTAPSVGGSSELTGVQFRSTSGQNTQNNIITDCTGSAGASPRCLNGGATTDHNLTSDATATGTGSLTNKTAANQFVSTVGGSEDLHLKTGADAINAGTDLGTSPTNVNIDIDGRDVDAEGDTWDMGADEFVSVGGAGAGMIFGGLAFGAGRILGGLVLA